MKLNKNAFKMIGLNLLNPNYFFYEIIHRIASDMFQNITILLKINNTKESFY